MFILTQVSIPDVFLSVLGVVLTWSLPWVWPLKNAFSPVRGSKNFNIS
jgi:hypothetical protein